MAIDYGDARIGIALTDPLKITASGYSTLSNSNDIYLQILNICKEKDVEAVVVGIPFNEKSEIGYSAKKVLDFSKKLYSYLTDNNIKIPFYEQDERYTTIEAYNLMNTINLKRKKRKKVIDQIAATYILMDFMKSSSKKVMDFSN